MQLESFVPIRRSDRPAAVFDVRPTVDVAAGAPKGAVHLPREEVGRTKDSGRLPVEDH